MLGGRGERRGGGCRGGTTVCRRTAVAKSSPPASEHCALKGDFVLKVRMCAGRMRNTVG